MAAVAEPNVIFDAAREAQATRRVAAEFQRRVVAKGNVQTVLGATGDADTGQELADSAVNRAIGELVERERASRSRSLGPRMSAEATLSRSSAAEGSAGT
jgi:hypothetical protein